MLQTKNTRTQPDILLSSDGLLSHYDVHIIIAVILIICALRPSALFVCATVISFMDKRRPGPQDFYDRYPQVELSFGVAPKHM